MLKLVDAHQHLWNRTRLHLPWIQPGSRLDRNYLPSDYQADTSGLGIVETIYVEVDVDPLQLSEEADQAIEACRHQGNPVSGAVIGGRPASHSFRSYLQLFKDNPYVKGVRQVLHVPSSASGYCLEPDFVDGIRALGEAGLSFELCMRCPELADARTLIAQCPDTQFVLDHCGNPDVQSPDISGWQRSIEAIGKLPNVVCKISGLVTTARPGAWAAEELAPFVDHCSAAFGPDRILFGSDWPVCTLVASVADWLTALQSIVSRWSETDQSKLFRDNARRFYAIN